MEEFVVDTSQPSIPPPNHSISELGVETRESKKRVRAWERYIEAYGKALG